MWLKNGYLSTYLNDLSSYWMADPFCCTQVSRAIRRDAYELLLLYIHRPGRMNFFETHVRSVCLRDNLNYSIFSNQRVVN